MRETYQKEEAHFFIVCDSCEARIDRDTEVMEWQETLLVEVPDRDEHGERVYRRGDFCQGCLQYIAGDYLRITEDDPFWCHLRGVTEPRHTIRPPDLTAGLEVRLMRRLLNRVQGAVLQANE